MIIQLPQKITFKNTEMDLDKLIRDKEIKTFKVSVFFTGEVGSYQSYENLQIVTNIVFINHEF